MTIESLRLEYERILQDATRLVGGLPDLQQRAAVYRHLFLASGRNHCFPLIAAHGALWSGGYFRFGMGLGRGLAWLSLQTPREELMRRLEEFADVFRDINRRVCIDTYASFHFSRVFGSEPLAERFIDRERLANLNRIHAAVEAGVELPDAARRQIFESHFLNEQEHVVGPTLARAVEAFDWPLLKSIALRPLVRFAYFPGRSGMWFRNFASREERIAKGLRAFDVGAEVGWLRVEGAGECRRAITGRIMGTEQWILTS